MREVIAGIALVSLFLIPGSAFAYWVPGFLWTGNRTGTGTTRAARRISRRQSRWFTWSSLAWKHTVRNIWKSWLSIYAGLWRLSGILPSRTVLVVSSLVEPSISDMEQGQTSWSWHFCKNKALLICHESCRP